MIKISILGASGSIGAPTAFYIAMTGLADELLMIGGKQQNVLEHHAIDIAEATAAANCRILHGSYDDLAGSDIVINAAGAHLPLHLGRQAIIQEQVKLIKNVNDQLQKHCPNAIVITAVNPIDATNYATYLLGNFDRKKLIGYAMNDTIRFQQSLAREMKEDVNRVEGIVIGEHGPSQVPLFSSVKVGGQAVQLTDEMKLRIREGMWDTIKKYEALKAGRTGGWTCAVGLTMMVRAIIENSDDVLACSVNLKGEYCQNDISMGVPVRLGSDGVRDILEYDLTSEEAEGLKKTTETLESISAIVREAMGA